MKIYVAHSRDFDFKKELYKPLRESGLNDAHEIILPHEESDEPYPSKNLLKSSCDLVIAEVSSKSTGVGIELGWASAYGVPAICVYKTGSKPSNSLKEITSRFIEYSDSEELISKLEEKIKNL